MKKKQFVILAMLLLSFRVFSQNWTVYNKSNSTLPDNLIKTVNVDLSGNIWLVTGDCFTGGVVECYNMKTFIKYDTADGIPDRFVTSIAFDSAGTMWFGSRYHGISSYDGKRWVNYNPSNSKFPDKHVRSVAIDKNHRVWACTDNGLAVFYNAQWNVMNKANSALPDNAVNSVAFDKKSNAIWIATDKGVLWAYDFGAIQSMLNVAPIVYNKKNSLLPDDQVTQVITDDSDNVWLSCWGGIAKIENGKWKVYTPKNTKLPDFVEYIMTKHNDELWVATNNGLYIFKNNNWQIFTPSNSPIPDFFVNKVAFTSDGTAWIATQSGLAKLK